MAMRKFNQKGQGNFTIAGFQKLNFFGGSYCTQRKFRVARPLSTREPMHLVLRSTQAKGLWSFSNKKNKNAISSFILKKARKFGITIDQLAIVGNHMHLLIRINNRHTYKPFICAFTGGIVGLVTGGAKLAKKFWDYRPFSRIVHGLKGYLGMRDYIKINQFEAGGVYRDFAVLLVKGNKILESG